VNNEQLTCLLMCRQLSRTIAYTLPLEV